MALHQLRTAAQQALEALVLWATGRDIDAVALNDLIFRLEAALAEPVQEPVAWRVQRSDGQYELYFLKTAAERAAEGYIKRPPVEPLYTAPPQRPPLTEEEIEDLDCVPNVPGVLLGDIVKFARAVERKVRGE